MKKKDSTSTTKICAETGAVVGSTIGFLPGLWGLFGLAVESGGAGLAASQAPNFFALVIGTTVSVGTGAAVGGGIGLVGGLIYNLFKRSNSGNNESAADDADMTSKKGCWIQ